MITFKEEWHIILYIDKNGERRWSQHCGGIYEVKSEISIYECDRNQCEVVGVFAVELEEKTSYRATAIIPTEGANK